MAEKEKYSDDNLVLSSTINSDIVNVKQSCETIYGLLADGICKSFAFSGSQNTLLSINFPQGSHLSDINDCAFYHCNKLSSVDFTNCQFLTKIGAYAFSGCTSLTSIILPIHLKIISENCFESTPISFISIPNEVTEIRTYSFLSCSKLTSISIKIDSKLQKIGFKAFLGTMIETFFIPKSIISIDEYAFDQNVALKEFTIDPSNTNFIISDGILFNNNQNTILRFPANKSQSYTIPDRITALANDAFSYTSLESIQFPKNQRSIGNWCFTSSKLSSLIIPDTVTSIGEGAFSRCVNLNSIIIGKGITVIPRYCFNEANISQLTIPLGVTTILYFAFADCK